MTIEVQDQGVGIPADEQPRIFERFTRGSHPDRGGYGLGLYLVRHIVQAHGGHVELSSAPGEGSRFRLLFPTVDDDVKGHAHAQGLAGLRRGGARSRSRIQPEARGLRMIRADAAIPPLT